MKMLRRLTQLVSAVGLLTASSAAMASTPGTAFNIAVEKFGALIALIMVTAIVVGFATTISGIYHFKNSAHDRLRYPIGEGIARMLVGVALMVSPLIAGIVGASLGIFDSSDIAWDNGANGGLALSQSVMEVNQASNSFLGQMLGQELLAIAFGILWLLGALFLVTGIYSFKTAGKPGMEGQGHVQRGITLLITSSIMMHPIWWSCTFLSIMPGQIAMCTG